MADVSIIQIDGTDYNIKDSTARTSAGNALTRANESMETANTAKTLAGTAQTTANSAQEKANANSTAIANLESKTLSVSYANEKITFTEGV